MLTTEPIAFKLFSVSWLQLTEAYSVNSEMGVWKHTKLFSLNSMTKTTNYTAKIPLTVQLLKGKKFAHYSFPSFRLFHLVQTRLQLLPTSSPKNWKVIWNLTLSVQFSPPHLHKGQLPDPGKALPVKFATPGAQRVVKCLRFARREGDADVSVWSAHYHWLGSIERYVSMVVNTG